MGWAAQIGGFYTKNLQGSPSLKCSSWDSLLKSAHFQHFFFIVWLQNSNNDFDAFQKLMKSELFGCLSIKAEGELHMCKIYWYVPPKLVYFTHSVNMGPIVTPPPQKKKQQQQQRNIGSQILAVGVFVKGSWSIIYSKIILELCTCITTIIVLFLLTTMYLTAHNWQKWKRVFLTCPCHKI